MVVSVFAKGLYHVAGLRPVDTDFDRRRAKQQYELWIKRLNVEFDHKLQKLYEGATGKGLWKGTAAASNRVEYWAAGPAEPRWVRELRLKVQTAKKLASPRPAN
jgi:hypothetical protein